MRKWILLISLCVLWALPIAQAQETELLQERTFSPIALDGPVTDPALRMSGLDWYNDTLILLPQFPQGAVFGIPRQALEDYIGGVDEAPITPQEIPLTIQGDLDAVYGEQFEGFEALAFDGETAYVTVMRQDTEAELTVSEVLRGELAPDLSTMTLTVNEMNLTLAQPSDVYLPNRAFETLVIIDDALYAPYEANGAAINAQPTAPEMPLSLEGIMREVSFPTIPYRITDATRADENGVFWVINYNFPGDELLQTDEDPLAEAFGIGVTHTEYEHVERLVQMRFTGEGFELTDLPPLYIQLTDTANNWEGLALFGVEGFLVVTDMFPETSLAYIAEAVPETE